MAKKGGGSTTTQTVQQADPWAGVQPYLADLYGNAASTFASGPRGAYPGQLTPGINPNLHEAWSTIYNKGMGTDPTLASANGTATNFMQGDGLNTNPFVNGNAFTGDYFATGRNLNEDAYANGSMSGYRKITNGGYLTPDSNPYMRDMVGAAERPIVSNFQNAIAPALASQFSAAGRTGSGSHVAAFDQAAETLGRQLSDTSSQLYGQQYQFERGLMEAANEQEQQRRYGAYTNERNFTFNAQNANKSLNQNAIEAERQHQMAAIGMAPALNQAGYYGLNQAQGVGQQIYSTDQASLDAAKAAFETNRDEPFMRLGAYSNILNGAAPYASQSGSQTQNLPKANPFMSTIGGGLAGGALGTMIPALGGPMGALIGAGLGLFG